MSTLELFTSGFFRILTSLIIWTLVFAPIWASIVFLSYQERKGKAWAGSPLVVFSWVLLSFSWLGGVASVVGGA